MDFRFRHKKSFKNENEPLPKSLISPNFQPSSDSSDSAQRLFLFFTSLYLLNPGEYIHVIYINIYGIGMTMNIYNTF